jgi:hypothetical protein
VDPEKYLPIEQLHSIFRGIVNALVYHGTTQRLRGNLYTALLNYLQYVLIVLNFVYIVEHSLKFHSPDY